jgi:hypothetical protein
MMTGLLTIVEGYDELLSAFGPSGGTDIGTAPLPL